MRDATGLMDNYRECVRHLWNLHFRQDAERSQDWDLRDEFDDAAAVLFHALVLRKLGRSDIQFKPDYRADRDVLEFLHVEVEPRSSIMVNRGLRTGYWDDPLQWVEKGQLDMRFLQFFDWWVLGFRDFAYYRVRIVGSDRFSHLVGRDALLPVGSAVRLWSDDVAEQADAADEAQGGTRTAS